MTDERKTALRKAITGNPKTSKPSGLRWKEVKHFNYDS